MCGITAFICAPTNRPARPVDWLERAIALAADADADPLVRGQELRSLLAEHFDDLASFSLHDRIATEPALREGLESVGACLDALAEHAAALPSGEGEELLGFARDYSWQIHTETLGLLARANGLLPAADATDRAQRMVAFATTTVLDNLGRLEVRGRDSAGIRCLLTLDRGLDDLSAELREALATRRAATVFEQRTAWFEQGEGGGLTCSFNYKVAQPIGRLGDNTRALSQMITADGLFWSLAQHAQMVSIVAHTRWASNGIISIANCHPVELAPTARESGATGPVAFVLNGDVDNCNVVLRKLQDAGVETEARVTTDAKVLPLLHARGYDANEASLDAVTRVLNGCEGSLAIVMQDGRRPRQLCLGLKGAGQALYTARTADGWLVASEEYGLAAQARARFSLTGQSHGGTVVLLDDRDGDFEELPARHLEDGREVGLSSKRIEIYSRDINRGDFDYYLEKELHDAPSSIAKTIEHRYSIEANTVRFLDSGRGTLVERLLPRLTDSRKRAFDRVIVLGQGTASIAAMGVAHLIREAVGGAIPTVEHAKAAEVSAWSGDTRMDTTLVVAISQSGTTTDTNRTVEWCMQRGAWAHAIVNRRGSQLVQLADSFTLTSDGRDVEMSVASTKAFYSQIAAGKILSIAIARALDVMPQERAAKELHQLEALPDRVREVLERDDEMRQLAEDYAASSTNWAVVGNGPNYVAAQEIRIKLSELCYKSIPCDYTEDKKHIDLSTEPLTLVCANDLPDAMAQDTAKEVAIFKAHAGRPLVFCAQGEERFDAFAERAVKLPRIEGGLSFVLATAAGHLFGYHAAKSIDRQAQPLRALRAALTDALDGSGNVEVAEVAKGITAFLERVGQGACNAALSPAVSAKLAGYGLKLAAEQQGELSHALVDEGIALCNLAVDALTRPVDTIRHQAKTVTVGISRPEDALPETISVAVEGLGIKIEQIGPRDLFELRVGAALAEGISGATLYSVQRSKPSKGEPVLKRERSEGASQLQRSRYDEPSPAAGSKRRALRLRRMVWGRGGRGDEAWCIVPVFEPDETDPSGLLLLHVEFPNPPAVVKASMLRRLGRYEDVIEALEEELGDAAGEAAVEHRSLIELLAM